MTFDQQARDTIIGCLMIGIQSRYGRQPIAEATLGEIDKALTADGSHGVMQPHEINRLISRILRELPA